VKEEAEGVRLDKPVEARTGIAKERRTRLFRKRTNESEAVKKCRLRRMVAGTSPATEAAPEQLPVEPVKIGGGGDRGIQSSGFPAFPANLRWQLWKQLAQVAAGA